MPRVASLLLLLIAGSLATAQTETELPRIAVNGTCMGPITYNVLAVDPPSDFGEAQLQQVAQQALDRVNDLMSTYQQDSDVSRVNRSDAGEWVSVQAETARVVQRALTISEQSSGAFDITVGPAVNLWKFGPDKEAFEVPSDAEIAKLKQVVGYQRVNVRLDPPAIRKDHPDVQIDLSAIAKGYAVDQVALALESRGVGNYMVEVGGEVRTGGHRQTGGPWRVGIEKPDAQGRVPDLVAEVADRSMATSGDYRNYRRVGNRRYSHTIDPTTCRPVEHDLASACILADDCMTADALATAAMVMGLKRGEQFLKQQGVDYYLVQRSSDFGVRLSRVAGPGFPFAGGRPEGLATSADDVIEQSKSESIWPAFVGAVIVFALVITGMAVGSIFANKPVRGSCGGLANMTGEDGEAECSICSKPTADCVERDATTTSA